VREGEEPILERKFTVLNRSASENQSMLVRIFKPVRDPRPELDAGTAPFVSRGEIGSEVYTASFDIYGEDSVQSLFLLAHFIEGELKRVAEQDGLEIFLYEPGDVVSGNFLTLGSHYTVTPTG
jgi:hypothetical protein